MRTNFLIGFLVFFVVTATAQTTPAKDKRGSEMKLENPDMSVLNDSKTNAPAKKSTVGDTLNIIPPTSYARLSFGGQFGMAFGATDVPADAMYPGFGGYVKYSFSHVAGLRFQYLHGKFSGAPNTKKSLYNASYHTVVQDFTLQMLFNIGSVDFRQSFPRNNFYFGFGATLQNVNGTRENPDTPSNNTLKISENMLAIPLTIGYKRKISKSIDVGLEFNYLLGSNDNLDLLPLAGSLPDGNGYLVATVVYNLTTKKKPQHIDWSNPIDKIYRDLKDAKDQAEAMKNDTDKDGVPDFFDQEPNTKEGYKVDNKGVTLDSDGDGIPDTIDPDPYGFGKTVGLYFPSGLGNGNDSSENIYKFNDSIPQDGFVTISKSGFGLPTIIFPPNRFTVHVEQFNLLQQIARILMIDTSASLVIIGHADNNKPNLTQLTLAERRALEVKRKLFKVYEIDEERMLVYSSKDPYVQKYQISTEGLDRKVEFRIIRPVEKRQPRVDTEDLREK
ncbi:MAG: hypothetical protein K9I36_15445 [Bacteroidia bacterium]|nr:hypothetical protein [Bacteroidia bacterium]MCF8428131.1 hypothetical protein [Bacteroidia bacterium]